MTSQRILSGSKTKGSTASLTGSAQYFYQGTSVRTFGSYVGSLLPRIGSSDRVELYKDGNPVSRLKEFDDSIIINNDLSDMGGTGDGKRIEERVNHSYENRNFGQAPTTLLGEPYADTKGFNPVHYIQDPGDVMWPTNMWNAGELDDHEFNGVIEPLDIRRELFGDLDTRYEGRAVRGSLVGASSERPWGSKEIHDKWYLYDREEYGFLDSPVTDTARETFHPTGSIPESFLTTPFLAPGTVSEPSVLPASYSASDVEDLELWIQLNAAGTVAHPTDLSDNNLSLRWRNLIAADSETEDTTIGQHTYSAFAPMLDGSYQAVFLQSEGHWNSIFGDAGVANGTHRFTLSTWAKLSDPENADGTNTIFAFGENQNASRADLLFNYSDDVVTGAPDAASRRPHVTIRGNGIHHFRFDTWATTEWDQLRDGEWHHLLATVEINNQLQQTDVKFYVDGELVPGQRVSSGFTSYSGTIRFSVGQDHNTPPGSFLGGVAGYGQIFDGTFTTSTLNPFDGYLTQGAIWSRRLDSSAVRAVYRATRNRNLVFEPEYKTYTRGLNDVAIQAYQNIRQSPDSYFTEQNDYHDRVYFSLLTHNNTDMRTALRMLNSSSCDRITDPFEKRSDRGLTEGQNIGSIAFSNSLIVGDKK